MAHIYDVNGKKIYLGGEIQYPEAYQLPIGSNPDNIGSLKPKIVKAHADKAADRPDSAHFEFYCIGCHSRMHWVKGAQRERQGNPSTPQPNYGRSFFQHNPYTLKNHLTMEAPLLVADLGTIVENISYVNNLTYEAVATLSASARIIALTANLAYGKKNRVEFLIAPNKTAQIPDDFDGVVITVTGGMAENHKRLVFTGPNGVALTGRGLNNLLKTEKDPVKSLMVSGILTETNYRDLDNQVRFRNNPHNVITAMMGVMYRSFEFVEHVDAVDDHFMPIHSRYGLFPSDQVQEAKNLVARFDFVVQREIASKLIANTFGYTRGRDAPESFGSRMYKYGGGDFLCYAADTFNRSDGLVRPGAPKIVVNPDIHRMHGKVDVADWENTLLVFYKNWKAFDDFKGSNLFKKLQAEAPGFRIISVSRQTNLLKEAHKHLGDIPDFVPAKLSDIVPVNARELALAGNIPPDLVESPDFARFTQSEATKALKANARLKGPTPPSPTR